MDLRKLLQQERARLSTARELESEEAMVPPVGTFQRRLSWPATDASIVPDTANCVTYVTDALSQEGIAWVLRRLETAEGKKGGGWVHLKNRSLLNLGGTPYFDGLITEPLPRWFSEFLGGLGCGEMNQALINRYQNGKGISPHMDGPLYSPKAVIVSLTGSALLRFYDARGERELSVFLLEPNSVLTFEGEYYENMKHGIRSVGDETSWTESLDDDSSETRREFANKSLLRDPSVRSVSRKEDRVSITVRRVAKESRLATRVLSPEYHQERLRAAAWWRKAIDDVDA